MTELRKQFEGLPEIELHLKHSNVVFSDDLSRYVSEFPMLHAVSCYVNGAWYAFQEQQKKIDKIKSIIDSVIPYEMDMDTMRKVSEIKGFF